MPADTLRGVALLCRKHAVNGHCSLRKLLSILKAEGVGSGHAIAVDFLGARYEVVVPDGHGPGMVFRVAVALSA